MRSADLRALFLDYFHSEGHRVAPSSSLVPARDPSLLFTNAGMVQFKDVFLGRETRDYSRAASSQRCLRAGGKHNDLENVGYTARHHTFFEMLGNFSFGDYFKREAIRYAWTLLTSVLNIPPERLWVTVFEQDDEAAAIWLNEIKVDARRLSRIGAKDNFWSMGDTGPCGPCSEIFYDHGPAILGGPPGTPEADGDRFVEIWNLVFMQYDRDSAGELHPLPRPSIDTGMGLERLAAVMQGVHDNYQTDLFQGLIRAVIDLADQTGGSRISRHDPSLRVIADHIRACGFLITDDVRPSNEGRGYVLRRIIRRAARHGHKLGLAEPFFYKLVSVLVTQMGDAYPELVAARAQVEENLHQEEVRFAQTLTQGLKILEEDLARLGDKVIPGETVFRLYDTYGFPVDLTADIARERGLQLDLEGFDRHMARQRERARSASAFHTVAAGSAHDLGQTSASASASQFTGYERLTDTGVVTALVTQGHVVEVLEAGQEGLVFLDRTPFYAESGGQVGDTGILEAEEVCFEVQDTQKHGEAHAHLGVVKQGRLTVGMILTAQVDAERRTAIRRNHSATHLLHAALRQVLGPHVQQKGSLVAPDRLRFDFSQPRPVTPAELSEIEQIVNRAILTNAEANIRTLSMQAALDLGAIALFGEKYGETVRVLSFGDFSTELCGGTHVARVGDIGLFKIVTEGGVASGVRRIEAVTGEGALAWINQLTGQLDRIAHLVRTNRLETSDKVRQLIERTRTLEKEIEGLKAKRATESGADLSAQAVEIDGIKVLAACLEHADSKALRETVDRLKDKLGSAAIVLASVQDDKVSLVAGVTKDQMSRIKAGDLVNAVATQVGGRGGGRPDLAQAGGNDPAALESALKSVPDWVRVQVQ